MRYLILIALLFADIAFADPPDNYPFLSFDSGLQQAQQEKKHIFVYFGRYGCGFCAKTNIESFSDPELKKRYVKNYILVYADAESGNRLTLPSGERLTEAELGAQLNVFATPVFLYLDMNGEVLFRAPGFKTVEEFVEFDRYIQEGHYKTKSINEFLSKR
ncbi:MAG: thioredoxin fold domain-containing protein [Gammaproteobacteria bacterium]|nr:thioredoxin fold domain-containing protein [Gammaproteobacteria bacterium]